MADLPLTSLLAFDLVQDAAVAPQSIKKLLLLSGILIAMLVFMYGVLALSVARRRAARRRTTNAPRTATHPLCRGEVDPWQESARRLDESNLD